MKKKKKKKNKNNVVCWSPHVKFKNIDKRDWKKNHVAWLIATCQFSFLKKQIWVFSIVMLI